jgi:pilus assembly protein FimV
MSQKVQQLESQLAESQRLLQARNDELAQLQARASQAVPAKPVAPAAAPTTPAPVPVPAPTQNAAPAPNATPAPPATTPEPAPPGVKPAIPPAAVAAPAAGTSIMDLIEEYWYVPAILVAIVLGLLAMRAIRARQEDEFDRSVGRLHPAFEGTVTSSALRAVDNTMPVRTLPATIGEQSYRVEESGAHEQPTALHLDRTAEGPALQTGEHVVIDDTVTGEHPPVALDQGDPLAEADFHMAYGLYDQAADLVQIAMSREPNRRDLKLKLLEVFFVWGNKDRFLQSARELANTRDQALPGEWEKVVIMGRHIAPEDALFASSGALSGAASGGVDLNLEGGQNRVDFDLLGEPTASEPIQGVGLDLDLGAALGDSQPALGPDKSGDSGVDFVLDDPERGNDATGSTREMPEAPPRPSGATATMQVIGAGNAPSDAPTIEQAQLHGGENATIREKIDAATLRGGVSADQTAELALDDLGLDLGQLESGGDETILQGGHASHDSPTMLAGMDEETRVLMSSAQDDDTERTQITPAPPATSESGTWLFTDADLTDLVPDDKKHLGSEEADNPTEIVTQLSLPPHMDSSSTGRMQTLNTSGLDLDLGNLGVDKSGHGIDLDVGAPSVGGEGTFVQTQRIVAADIPLPELEPATMSEVGTKLDLARAYMDMGDPEGARSILAEVLAEGSVSQKQEARRLMDTLPG